MSKPLLDLNRECERCGKRFRGNLMRPYCMGCWHQKRAERRKKWAK